MRECLTTIFNGYGKSRGSVESAARKVLPRLLITTITLPRWNFGLRLLLAIAGKRTSDVSNILKLALLISPDKAFICTGINQLTMTLIRLLRHLSSSPIEV
jgi:hypothetical protein